ncbi:MAG: hypothetical protein JXR97_10515 [Planctomycetes bacterium]|nr:hypothetical protein [Planctomycetota bacterium]
MHSVHTRARILVGPDHNPIAFDLGFSGNELLVSPGISKPIRFSISTVSFLR